MNDDIERFRKALSEFARTVEAGALGLGLTVAASMALAVAVGLLMNLGNHR